MSNSNTPNERKHETDPAARTPESLADYCARVSSEILADCKARDSARALRAESFARACRSSASIHCAETDRRDYHEDALRESAEELQAVRAAAEVSREPKDTGPRPDGTD